MHKTLLSKSLFFFCLAAGPVVAQTAADSIASTRWYSSRASGAGLPLGAFARESALGFSSTATVVYRLGKPTGKWWVGVLGAFGNYGFTSSFVQNGIQFELEGERGVYGAFGVLGRELPLGEKFSLHLYAGVGGSRIGSSELNTNLNATQVTARSRGALFYGWLAGTRLEYAFRPRMRPFVSVLMLAHPTARFGAGHFLLGIPQVGYSIPLSRRPKT